MVEDSISEDNTTTNKGVNVHSESLPARVHRYRDIDTSSSANTSVRSINEIRNELQTVLDLMGPTTPSVTTQNSSSEADNEESTASVIFKEQIKTRRTVSSTSREKKSRSTSTVKETSASITQGPSSYAESNDRHTLSNELQTDKDSDTNKETVMADAGTMSTLNNSEDFEELENSCCDHNHLFVNPECICMVKYMNPNMVPVAPSKPCLVQYSPSNKSTTKMTAVTTAAAKKRNIITWLKEKSLDLKFKKPNPNSNPYDLYRINICGQGDDGTLPRRVVFDMVDGLPRPTSSTVATNTVRNHGERSNPGTFIKCDGLNISGNCKQLKNIANENITIKQEPNKIQKNIFYDSDGNKRVDFYYFDHGNTQYFHTTDTPPVLMSEIIAEKTERYTTKFWAEFFSSIHIAVAFCISFILQFFKFLLYSIIRPLSVGLMQMGSDYFFKPFLTMLFNGLLQPFLIFLYNIATSLRDLCDPIAEGFGYFCRELAVLFRAIRLCSYRKSISEEGNCDCDKKKCEC